jgi:hypothetical protein
MEKTEKALRRENSELKRLFRDSQEKTRAAKQDSNGGSTAAERKRKMKEKNKDDATKELELEVERLLGTKRTSVPDSLSRLPFVSPPL